MGNDAIISIRWARYRQKGVSLKVLRVRLCGGVSVGIRVFCSSNAFTVPDEAVLKDNFTRPMTLTSRTPSQGFSTLLDHHLDLMDRLTWTDDLEISDTPPHACAIYLTKNPSPS